VHLKHLKKNIAYAIGSAANSAVLFLLIPFFINILPPDQYGIWSIIEVSILFITMFCLAGIDVGLMKEYWYKDDQNLQKILTGTAIIAVIGWSIVLTIILFGIIWFGRDISFIADIGLQTDIVALVLVTSSIEAIFSLVLSLYRIREQAKLYVIFSFVRMLLFLIAAIIGVQFDGVRGALVGRLLAALFSVAIAIVFTWRSIIWLFRWDLFQSMLRFGIPLLPANIAAYILLASDRFILERYVTLEAVAVYTFAYKIATTLDILVIRPFSLDWAPRRFKIANEENAPQKYSDAFLFYLFTALGFLLIMVVGTPLIYAWIAPKQYSGGIDVVVVVLLAYVIYGASVPLNVGIMLRNKNIYLPFITWGAAGVCILLNMYLIPRFMLFGAAWATVLAYLVYTIGIAWTSLRIYPIPYPKRSLMLLCGGTALGYVGIVEIGRLLGDITIIGVVTKIIWIVVLFAWLSYILLIRTGRINLSFNKIYQ
jgi:O-antigen/teichoic acid export membrane protein